MRNMLEQLESSSGNGMVITSNRSLLVRWLELQTEVCEMSFGSGIE